MNRLLLLFLLVCPLSVQSIDLFSDASGLSWDSDELTRLRSLHKREFNDPEVYTKSTSLADYLGLSAVRGIHLTIPVNIILIGFDKGKTQISPDDLQAWFETLDHIVPHTRVPLSEVTCKEDGYCVNFDLVKKPKPLPSYVHYNISVHAVETSTEMSQKFSEVLRSLSRPLFLGADLPQRQIDVTGMEAVVDGMLGELGIVWNYNVILANPDVEVGYSYRAGLSVDEIYLLLREESKLSALKHETNRFKARIPVEPGRGLANNKYRPNQQRQKFNVKELVYQSNRWSQQISSWIKQRDAVVARAAEQLGDMKELLLVRGIHGDSDLSEMIEVIERSRKNRAEMKSVGGLRVLEPEESCSLDIWAGHRRWIYMDLAASRQDWGPYVGGDGIKTIRTLPSINQYFMQPGPADNRDASEDVLNEMAAQRKASIEQMHSYKVEGKIDKDVLRETELDLLNRFHNSQCLHSLYPPIICERIAEAMRKLAKREDIFAKDGEDSFMDWFSLDENVDKAELSHAERMKDLFLAHASAVVSRAIRHVFVPPTLTWRQNEEGFEVSTSYAKSVAFRIHLIFDPRRDPAKPQTEFDVEGFKKELSALKLLGQEFEFLVHRQNLLADPLLSSVLAASLRTSTVESLDSDINSQIEERVYIDSSELQELIFRRLFNQGLPEKKNKAARRLEVPVFVFMLDREDPIFIDQHYIARALEHLVLVVQNGQYRGQHPLGLTCGGEVAGQTLAAPLKATLAAVLEHLGGVLPSHLGYSPEHKAVAHDWTWSVGANPFSLTSPGWKISQAQKDALHRTYVLDAVDMSVERINQGIALLESIKTTEQSFEFVKKEAKLLNGMLQEFGALVEAWRRIMNDASNLDFERAIARLFSIEEISERFLRNAKLVARGMSPLDCRSSTGRYLGISEEIVGGCLLAVVCFVIYRLFPKGKAKKY